MYRLIARGSILRSSNSSSLQLGLAKLSSHLVVALIALIVIGGATRVMEAGLACPDWPLCYGSFLPGRHMNIRVFLEWFHRLDAFLIGIALLVQFIFSFIKRNILPKSIVWVNALLLLLVGIQGGLGALTVTQLLPPDVVTAHLILALSLVAIVSSLSQRLIQSDCKPAPPWWRIMGVISIVLVICQSLIGGKMATTWASRKCLEQGSSCHLLDIHRYFAIPVTTFILAFIIISLCAGGWVRSQWPFYILIFSLILLQILFGLSTVHLGLSKPIVTILHQLDGALLVATFSSLIARRPYISDEIFFGIKDKSFMEACHG